MYIHIWWNFSIDVWWASIERQSNVKGRRWIDKREQILWCAVQVNKWRHSYIALHSHMDHVSIGAISSYTYRTSEISCLNPLKFPPQLRAWTDPMAQVFWNLDVVATFMTGYYENGNLILEPVKTFGWNQLSLIFWILQRLSNQDQMSHELTSWLIVYCHIDVWDYILKRMG